MAKKRKYKKKSSKCPEPFNTIIDIAAGIAMGAIADRMEKKYHYSKKGKINPYAASAIGIATGRIRNTEDVLRTGAFLGAMGSFDVEADNAPRRQNIQDDKIFGQMRETKTNDNRYAWRSNCENGSKYGISPQGYETREEYNNAILAAKGEIKPDKNYNADKADSSLADKAEPISEKEQYLRLRVSRLDNGSNQYYISKDISIKIGDTVSIPTESGCAKGIVIATEPCPDSNLPKIIEKI